MQLYLFQFHQFVIFAVMLTSSLNFCRFLFKLLEFISITARTTKFTPVSSAIHI